jgi:PST family polysaccharide transporter
MNRNLTKSTAYGVMWTAISQLSTQVFQFIVIIILARLLYPEQFGIVGMAAIFTGFISRFNELGLSAAIIQRKNVDEIHLSTSFWTSLGTGTILCILTILLSPFIADFFKEDLVRPILIVSSLNFIVGSFNIIPRTLLVKNLNFKKTAIADICAAFVSGTISIILAINNYGAWSLVFGGLINSFISGLILWRINPWRPSSKFSISHFKELFSFGGHVMGSNILNYVDTNVDYLVVGKMIGAAALGYYTLAYNLITFPLQKISKIVTSVTFPAFSKIQDDNQKLKDAYLKVVQYISLITFPMIAGLFIVAPEFIVVIYGSKWVSMILPLQLLCPAGALKSVGTTVGSIILSKGRADIQFKWNICTAIVLTIAVIIGVNYGIAGVAAMISIVTVLLFLIIQNIANKLIGLSMSSYLMAIYPAIIGSITLIIAVEVLKKILIIYSVPDIGILISSVLIGIVVYILFIRIFFNNLLKEIRIFIKEMRG